MGFALPTLSCLSFLRLAQGIRLPSTTMGAAMEGGQHAASHPSPAVGPEQGMVISLSKARRRSQQRRGKAARQTGDAKEAQLLLPLQPVQATPDPRSRLRIIQRSPQERPECLFISGRMADVCAALERIEAHGGQLKA